MFKVSHHCFFVILNVFWITIIFLLVIYYWLSFVEDMLLKIDHMRSGS